MKTLLVLRHAKSSWKQPELSDHDRPLNKRGQRDAPRVGQFLQSNRLVPDLILSSTAVRARSTADEVADGCGEAPSVTLEPRLYLADPDAIIDVVQSHGGDAQRVLVVAHNPGCAELVMKLTGRSEEFPTAALAHIDLPIAAWSDLGGSTQGKLSAIWRPKEGVSSAG